MTNKHILRKQSFNYRHPERSEGSRPCKSVILRERSERRISSCHDEILRSLRSLRMTVGRRLRMTGGEGFTLIEIIVVILLAGGALVFLIKAIPSGLEVFIQSSQGQKLYFLAQEKMAEIRAQKIWLNTVDTQNPTFPTRSLDPANQWKADLDMDSRSFSSAVRGQITVTYLRSDYTLFQASDYTNTSRERFEITVTMSQGVQLAIVTTIITAVPSQDILLGMLYMIKRALLLYNQENGSYPNDSQLDRLTPNYLPYLPNDPYTTARLPYSNADKEESDWDWDRSQRKLFARSHDDNDYPNLVLTW